METQKLNLKVWSAMEEIYQSKGTRQLGISNCYDLKILKDLYNSVKVKPAVVQNRFYKKSDYDVELRNWCKTNNIIYQSFWTLSANPDILNSKTILDISQKMNKTNSQILFRFLTQMDIAPLTGTSSEQHMKEDLDIFEFKLSKSDIEAINSLFI